MNGVLCKNTRHRSQIPYRDQKVAVTPRGKANSNQQPPRIAQGRPFPTKSVVQTGSAISWLVSSRDAQSIGVQAVYAPVTS
jgi:hypothetical protein